MIGDDFHEIVSVVIPFGRIYSSEEISRIFKTLGAKLHYVYSFDRFEKGPVWQSESYVYTELFCEGIKVDIQEQSDSVELQYPLATISAEYIVFFAELVEKTAATFSTEALLNGKPVDKQSVISWCDSLTSNLMSEWGEEPGSKNLRILIESNYG